VARAQGRGSLGLAALIVRHSFCLPESWAGFSSYRRSKLLGGSPRREPRASSGLNVPAQRAGLCFWESLGYHNHGDPWREERYWGD
jgi:DMSO/TMAO reductase YedYZ molybdopterin-dependent catalytic subunit